MLKLESNWIDLRYLDDLATLNTPAHRLNPLAKLWVTLGFVIAVTSFSKYEVTGLLPFLFYPVALISLGRIPWPHLWKRLFLVAPVVLFVGIFNPLLDHTPLYKIGSLTISGGWISFFSISLRLCLTVTAALLLVATTGMNGICAALFRCGVPRVMVVQLMFMFRYIHVLLEELLRTVQAYHLRSFHGEGIRFQAWGSLLGQLLLRTMDRAQRIYQSMLCRGFDGQIRIARLTAWQKADMLYVLGWLTFFLAARSFNIPQLFGRLLTGALL